MSIERARSLRKRMPHAEERLWNVLKNPPFKSYHFRRQVPIGPYFADFASHTARLVVEVDGDSHFRPGALAYDQRRDEIIRADGFTLMRLSNLDVMTNIDGVGTRILRHLASLPTRPDLTGSKAPRLGGSAVQTKRP